MWNEYELPTSVDIDGNTYEINYKFGDVLDIFKVLEDPDLLDQEKLLVALSKFYKEEIPSNCMEEAAELMVKFLDGNKNYSSSSKSPKLYDWEQDFSLIVAPVNKVLGYDIRGKKDVHWWTFLSAFMEIGECTFNTFVGIRSKRLKHKKLDKWEEQIYREHKAEIDLIKKYDSTTQSIIDEIMGRKG